MAQQWYEASLRRNVVDMHITELDDSFLTQLDPKRYVEMLVRARITSAVVYARSLTGISNYPTRFGHMHRCLRGRDVFGEIVEECHRRGVAVQAYMTIVWDRWAFDHHPAWRARRADGSGMWDDRRNGVCCVNSGYRDYILAQVDEVAAGYEFEGFRIDMEFWPHPCYCDSCRKRYHSESGRELPTVVNWQDPEWVAFQRAREGWLLEFQTLSRQAVKRHKPGASVEHQASTVIGPWAIACTDDLAGCNDYLQGDFYGDAAEGSLICKVLGNLTPHRPFAFETTRCLELTDHTTTRPVELLRAKAFQALAHGGAFVFIDAIDPVGTLDPAVYETMGGVFGETMRYERFLGGELAQDVGVYFNTRSKFRMEDIQGSRDVMQASDSMDYLAPQLAVVRSLIAAHVPFGVITRRCLDRLSRHSVLVLPNVAMMDEEEAEAIRRFVAAGGSLYASKWSSLLRADGRRMDDFLLADVFGVSWTGETAEGFTYVAPGPEAGDLLAPYTEARPLGIYGSQFLVEPRPGAKVLATLTLPWTDPADLSRCASIWSNPPGRPTRHPSIVVNRFGKGRSMYVAGDIERHAWHAAIFARLVRAAAPGPFGLESDAPACVEITRFEQPGRLIVCLLNFQKDLPNIPVRDIRVRIRADGRTTRRVSMLPAGRTVPFRVRRGWVEFIVPVVVTFAMLAVAWERATKPRTGSR